ncbi:PD-(D/E)XK nuclease-like domain-containing protein [Streptomyces sp. XY533]|uniref:PD-(D/E)XK nuclease-like domain-containing protein n=1 Tax=Streptomyces sp. XY533 TaxID=1519481 RepID=UPI0007C7428A|nr:PD-(D/E)XK nuclease-like domain-containing protein [Streptomyces sp. XY533]
MTATTEALVVTEPGIYSMTAEDYHLDPVPGGSLSSSGARRILDRSPATYHYEREHGQAPKRIFDLGHAAHREVLGEGANIAVIQHDNYTTKAAKADRDAARFDGLTPLLAKEYEQVQAMAAAIRQHPIAGRLFTPGEGIPEQALFWKDGPSGITRRALIDWTKHRQTGTRLVIADYKTTTDASLEAISRAVNEHGYHSQDAWYRDGAIALDLGDEDTVMVFVFQEKTAPYLITVVELDRETVRRGRERNRRAIEIYAECKATGHWPGHHDGVAITSLPVWAQLRHDEEYS